MPDYLKGNYQAPKIKSSDAIAAEKPADENTFEKSALERLGGSIAFVMKSKTFLWTPDQDKKDSPKP